MKKRKFTRALVFALSIALTTSNAAPMTLYAQENVTVQEEAVEDTQQDEVEAEAPVQETQQTVETPELTQQDVTLNKAVASVDGEITESTILEYVAGDSSYSLYYQFRTIDGKLGVVIKGYGSNTSGRDIAFPSSISAPNTFDNYSDYQNVPVIAIDQNAFRGAECPTSVFIPASVESIGENAFTNGTSTKGAQLLSVTIEDGSKLESIGHFAFQNQNLLVADIVIPEGVTFIGQAAFEGCAKITSVTFKGAGEIGEKAFYGCTSATGGIDLSCGVTSIGDNAFTNFGKNAEASEILLSNNLVSIGVSAFEGAKLTGDLVIPATLETMGKSAFSKAFVQDNNKGTLTFASGSKLGAIPDSAFNGNVGFQGDLIIPNSVTSIGSGAFMDGGFDGELTLSNKLTSIGTSAFQDCFYLTGDIVIPDTVTSMGDSAFYSCTGFDGSLTISKKLTQIPSKAFFGCKNLTGGLTLPSDLTSIGSEAFSGCESLTGALVIPTKVTELPKKVFYSCSGFTALTMPSNATAIGESAFEGCTGFANEFVLPTKLKTVSKNAFLDCSGFTGNLDMPDTVTSVGDAAFKGMSSLDGYLYISQGIKTLGMEAFSGCSGLVNPKDSKGNVIDIVIPEGVKTLDQDLFYRCFNLESIVLPGTITEISSACFASVNSDLDVYVYSGSGAATEIRSMSASERNFNIIYIDWLYEIIPSSTEYVVRVGDTTDVTADLVYYKYNREKDIDEKVTIAEADAEAELEWIVANENYATYKDGKISGLNAGTTSITVTEPSTGVGKKCTLRVVDKYVNKVVIKESSTKVTFDTSTDETEAEITATITLQYFAQAVEKGEIKPEDLTVEWTSSKDGVVEITSGDIIFSDDYSTATVTATVKAKNSGSTVVKAVATVAGDTKTVTSSGKTFVVFVPLKGVTVEGARQGRVGDTVQLTAKLEPANATTQKVTWKSSDKTIASVNSTTGVVTCKKEGTVTITCTPTTTTGDTAKPVELTFTVVAKDAELPDSGDSGNSGDNDDSDDDDTDVAELPAINVSYRTHIQSFGWEADENKVSKWKKNGEMSGTSGKAKRLEGINIVVNSAESGKTADLGIQYTTHCQSYGWLPWSANGDMNGTEGEAKRLEAIKIQLTGADADQYDVYYRVHAQSYGWLGWAKNGEASGTAGYGKRLEGIQIVVVKKGESYNKEMGGIKSVKTESYVAKSGQSPIVNYPSTSNTNPVIPGADTPNVAYRTHVQSFGWQGWKYNGQMSGTSGLAKRLEGIEINLTNQPYEGGIVYTTHVQSYGWQGQPDDASRKGWKADGEMSGTSGEAKRLEAICIDLTGEMAEHYDIYYRVHAQSFGWLGWAKNGEESGTAGYAKRLEGIQIVLVPKGGAAPANNYGGITSKDARPYIEK